MKIYVHAVVKLYVSTEIINEFEYRVLNKENLIEKLFEKVSSVIADKLFKQAISENYEFKEFLFNKNNLFTQK